MKLKYRGKSTETGAWLIGGYAQVDGVHCILKEGKASPVTEESVSISTGVELKSGEELFGGDIVEYGKKNDIDFYARIVYKAEVAAWCAEWYEGSLLTWETLSPGVNGHDEQVGIAEWVVVVGNETDNPEMVCPN